MAKVSNFKNMTLSLVMVCLVSSALLALVYVLTFEPISKAKAASENAAIGMVVPAFDNEPGKEAYEVDVEGRKAMIYPVKKSGDLIAYAIKVTTSKGFSGNVTLMVGITTEGTIYNSLVIAHAETPGLGDKMHPSKSNFPLQFQNVNPENVNLNVKQDGGDVDAITAATISSRAYCDAINMAVQAFKSL